MAIYLPQPLEPFIGTPEQWELYFEQQRKAIACYQAYRDTIGIFAIFSRKKRKAFEEALNEWRKARDHYLNYERGKQ